MTDKSTDHNNRYQSNTQNISSQYGKINDMGIVNIHQEANELQSTGCVGESLEFATSILISPKSGP